MREKETERERDRERKRQRERQRDRQREEGLENRSAIAFTIDDITPLSARSE